uniref:Uncharacterized protein n=1 Tax=Oryza sativa subsp. japonica TaxID=39947 RepID=Q6H469_ORYSJ|nr:hypothetical protein [Oryza sativa Japonica Group]
MSVLFLLPISLLSLSLPFFPFGRQAGGRRERAGGIGAHQNRTGGSGRRLGRRRLGGGDGEGNGGGDSRQWEGEGNGGGDSRQWEGERNGGSPHCRSSSSSLRLPA